MKIVQGLDSADLKLERSVLSIGNFDGFHRGHQQLVTQSALLAVNDRAPVVVITFEPHPVAVLRPQDAPARLSTLDRKLHLLAAAGVDVTVVAECNPRLLGMEAESFIDLLVDRCRPVHFVEGATFRFGRGRRGTAELLRSVGRDTGFGVCIIEPVRLQIEEDEPEPVSSSLIRSLIVAGKMHRASLCLGRRYALRGRVGRGAGRGVDLGFRTANVEGTQQLIPADGVYGGVATVGPDRALAAISVGTNPTFDGTERKVEAHLLDFEREIPGETIEVEFGVWLRAQRKFESANALRGQIEGDIAAVREWGRHEGLEK